MMKPRRTFNPKRKIQPEPSNRNIVDDLNALADRVSYGGNPEHKRNPGDFDLQPPSYPRQGKTLCDEVDIFKRSDALNLLRKGFRRGLVSDQRRNGWPQNVWAVASNGVPVEAMLENNTIGRYHGYPMLEGNPLSDEVKRRWKKR